MDETNTLDNQDIAKKLDEVAKLLAENTAAIQQSHDRLLKKKDVIALYFGGVNNNTVDVAMHSKDFPKVYLNGKGGRPLYPAKEVEQWIQDHIVYGY